jgi:hypothetical protein
MWSKTTQTTSSPPSRPSAKPSIGQEGRATILLLLVFDTSMIRKSQTTGARPEEEQQRDACGALATSFKKEQGSHHEAHADLRSWEHTMTNGWGVRHKKKVAAAVKKSRKGAAPKKTAKKTTKRRKKK